MARRSSIQRDRLPIFAEEPTVNGFVIHDTLPVAFGSVIVKGKRASTDRTVFGVTSNRVIVSLVTIRGTAVPFTKTFVNAENGTVFTVIEIASPAQEFPTIHCRAIDDGFTGSMVDAVKIISSGKAKIVDPIDTNIGYLLTDSRLSEQKAINNLIRDSGYLRTPLVPYLSNIRPVTKIIFPNSQVFNSVDLPTRSVTVRYSKNYADNFFQGVIKVANSNSDGVDRVFNLPALTNEEDAIRFAKNYLAIVTNGTFDATCDINDSDIQLYDSVQLKPDDCVPAVDAIVTGVDLIGQKSKLLIYKPSNSIPLLEYSIRHTEDFSKNGVISTSIKLQGNLIEYTVRDKDGNALSGATVSIVSDRLNEQFITDGNGVVVFSGEKGDNLFITVILDGEELLAYNVIV